MKKRDGDKPILINSENIAVQSNHFIEARYKESLTFWESFLITKMCSMISPDDVDFKPYKIYIKEVIDFMGLPPGGTVYGYIMDAAKRLLDRKIVIGAVDERGRKEIIETHIVTSVRRLLEPPQDENIYITLTFLPELRPYLLQLHKDFTKLDMEIYKRLKTASSIRLYHIFKSHIGKKHHKIQFDLEELKEILGVAGKYKQYAGFKMRVLDEAKSRLEESTDISFNYEEIKTGKKVSAISFYLNNEQAKTQISQQSRMNELENVSIASDEEQEKLILELTPIVIKKYGVSLKVFMRLVESHTAGEVRQAIEVTEKALKTGKIANAAGFFVEAVKGHYTDAKAQKKQAVIEQKKKNVEADRVEADIEKRKHDSQKEAFERECQIFEQIIREEPSFQQQLIDKIRIGLLSAYYKIDLPFDTNMQNPLVKATLLNFAKELKPQAFKS